MDQVLLPPASRDVEAVESPAAGRGLVHLAGDEVGDEQRRGRAQPQRRTASGTTEAGPQQVGGGGSGDPPGYDIGDEAGLGLSRGGERADEDAVALGPGGQGVVLGWGRGRGVEEQAGDGWGLAVLGGRGGEQRCDHVVQHSVAAGEQVWVDAGGGSW